MDYATDVGRGLALTLPSAFLGLMLGLVAGLGLAVLLREAGPAEEAVFAAGFAGPFIGLLPLFALLAPTPFGLEVGVAATAAALPVFVVASHGLRVSEAATAAALYTLGADAVRPSTVLLALERSLGRAAAALMIAVPAAVLGAVAAQFAGSGSGVGVLLINAMATSNHAQVYVATAGIVMCASLLAILGWAVGRRFGAHPVDDLSQVFRREPRPRSASAVRSLCCLLAVALPAGVFVLLLGDSYLRPSPVGILGAVAGTGRDGVYEGQFLHALARTTLDAALLFVTGALAGVVLTIAAVSWRLAFRCLMPLATASRALPLIVIAPLVVTAFGRGASFLAVLGVITVGLPTAALACANVERGTQATLWMKVQGASGLQRMNWCTAPLAVLAVAGAAAFAGVSAAYGAVAAEWLGTGAGLGYLIPAAISASEFDVVWAAALAVMMLAALAYFSGALLGRRAEKALAPSA
jgi:ABC-type nitrate/sulfonate/bicarbonate transport system permease component